MISLRYVRGLPFSNAPWFSEKFIEETMDYNPHDGDVIIASYPKTGTTWLQYIVLQIVTRAQKYPSFDDVQHTVMPYMEIVGKTAIDGIEGDRIYKHHYPYKMVKKNSKAKTIYTYRDPADTLVSYYYFLQSLFDGQHIDFEQFFEGFLEGNIPYGSYFDHVNSFFAHKEDGNILLVSYERLSVNRIGEILRIAKFLGEEHYLALKNDQALLEKVIEQTNFDYMKKHLFWTHPGEAIEKKPGEKKKTVNFFRKGKIGDSKNLLTPKQFKKLKDVIESRIEGMDLISEWKKEL